MICQLSIVRVVHRLCVFRWLTVSDLPASVQCSRSYIGHTGAIGGVYVICIWGATQMGKSLRNVSIQICRYNVVFY